MKAVSGIPDATPLTSGKSDPQKLIHAARQFEAVLLNQLLGSLEHTFSALGENKTEAGSDHYHFLGVQALTSSIAAKGGIGIAEMIVRNLRQRERRAIDSAKQQESLSGPSPERLDLGF
jgi:Rod binding domain-containing protein